MIYVFNKNEEKIAKMQTLLTLLGAGFKNNNEASIMVEACVNIANQPVKYKGTTEMNTAMNMIKFATACGLVSQAYE